jgi:hypothetical protein
MRFALIVCLGVTALAGCAGPEHWDHGEWLDRVSVRPAKPVQHTPEEQQALRAESQELQAQAEALRVKMASEKNRDHRIDQLKQLEQIGDEQRVVDKSLQGGPMPYRGLPIPQPADGGGDGG